MSQSPLSTLSAKIFGMTSFSPIRLDAQVGLGLLTTRGATVAALNTTAAGLIKTGPGRLFKAVIIGTGSTGGGFSLNDCLTVGTVAASNLLWTLPYNATTNIVGAPFDFDGVFFSTGLYLSVPTGDTPIINLFYT
jgi:hypothetical protein